MTDVDYQLFINGIHESVLKEIIAAQTVVPELCLYLQPYSGQTIRKLAQKPPSRSEPLQLFLSVTTDLNHVHYEATVIGWEDKRKMRSSRKKALTSIIDLFQPEEGGVYEKIHGVECVNLLTVTDVRELDEPFSVTEFIKTSDEQPMSPDRQTAGGWVYVQRK